MPKLFFTCLFLFPLNLLAQTEPVYEQGFGLEIGSHRANRRISGGAGVTFAELERQDSLESGIGGLGFGILYESRVDKIGFTTGVRYLETGYDIDKQPLRNDPTRSFSEEVRAKYISIPFELNFHQSITAKDRVSFMLGVAAHLHLKTVRERFTFQEEMQVGAEILENDPDASFRSPVLSLNTGIAFDRKINDDWAIKIQPNFQFFMQGNLRAQANQTNRNYYQLGLRVVVRKLFL